MNKLPAFQFYPGDWRKDPGVQSLSFHDRGIWFEIILLMHESEQRGKLLLNGRPMPETALARLLGLDNQILTTTLTTLFEFGVASRCEATGAIMCRRMVRDENLREVRKKAGKKGGNPLLVKQIPTTPVKQIPTTPVKQIPTTPVKQIPTPSSSPSGEDGVSSERKKRCVFQVPQFSEVESYIVGGFPNVDPEAFFAHYEANGWMVGKNRVKDWKACVRGWNARSKPKEKPKVDRCPWTGLKGEELEKWARENVETV